MICSSAATTCDFNVRQVERYEANNESISFGRKLETG